MQTNKNRTSFPFRAPEEIQEWLAGEALKSDRSKNAELLHIVKEEMRRRKAANDQHIDQCA